ncbi:hypothetical protein HUJ04_003654 [Dendroctonus ponderosae]
MNASILRALRAHKPCILQNHIIFFSNGVCLNQIHRPVFRQSNRSPSIGAYGIFMLIIPAASFGLGVWQVQRKTWKEQLIAEMTDRIDSAPIELPGSFDEIRELEYRPVRVRGTFLHDKEIYMGPRGLLQKDTGANNFLSLSIQGYHVITPFKLADRDQTILVNRGWVLNSRLKPHTRADTQIEGVVDVIGLVRLSETRPNFSVKNQENSNLYFYRDLEAMCAATGASPIFLDQTVDFNLPGGPTGGQTVVTLRNEHLSYIITWFSLSAATMYMWLKRYVFRPV